MAGTQQPLERARRDVVAMAIAIAAILMFVGTGGRVLPEAVRAMLGHGEAPDPVLVSALLLNIALMLFGWRRYRELTEEITVRRAAEAHARELASLDPLTGCLNRRSIAEATDAALAAAHDQGKNLAFIMLDLDNFKRINDLHSHQAGDAMLRATSQRLRSTLPPSALIARMGGGEFACVLAVEPRNEAAVSSLSELLAETVRQPVAWNDTTLDATVSVGLTITDHANNHDASSLMHMADIAMFHAKRQGRNQIAWFTATMESELRFRSELETGIRSGITAGEFVPYYEKQVDIATGELMGFEMLARWNSPNLGLVGPDLFIPVAEEIGVIGELSECVIRQALQDAQDWDPSVSLSVNISPVQLRDPWFAQKLLKLLVESNFPPSRLDIEITESCLHENIGMVRSMVTSLKNQGISVSLDDFGTGYSSLTQLRSLDFDRIKIDRSFITGLPESTENRTIVQSIISLGKGLGMPVTAEGVETAEVLAALQEFQGLKAQGYLYGYPSPAEATLAELKQMNLAADVAPAADTSATAQAASL